MDRYCLAVLERPGRAPLYALYDQQRELRVCGWDHRHLWITQMVADNNARWEREQTAVAPGEVRLVG